MSRMVGAEDMDIGEDVSKSTSSEGKKKKSSKEHRDRSGKEHKHKKSKKSKSHRHSPSKSPENGQEVESLEGNHAKSHSGNIHQTFDSSHLIAATNAQPKQPSPDLSSGQRVEELSIEETNKLRAKLGLKPLQVGNAASSTKQEEIHAPPVNLSHVKETAKIKEKLVQQKERRVLEKNLRAVKPLGESSDEEESLDTWVQKSRIIDEERRKAAERAKMLDELDEDQESSFIKPRQNYSSGDLQGLKVEHDLDEFDEDREIILTLKDSDVLKDEEGDVLVSSALTEEEKNRRNTQNRKKKSAYNPYENIDDIGSLDPTQSNVLRKYDEEIGGDKKKNFRLGQNQDDDRGRRLAEARPGVNMEQLTSATFVLAKDYYSEQEMTKFKKPKRLKKSKKEDGAKMRSRIVDDDEMPAYFSSSSTTIQEDDDHDLQLALNQARRTRQQEQTKPEPDFLQNIKSDPEAPSSSSTQFMDDTAEFCRSIGGNLIGKTNVKDKEESISASYNRFDDDDVNMEVDEDNGGQSEAPRVGGWSEVQFEAEPANLGDEDDGDREFHRKKRAARSKSGSGKMTDYKSALEIEPSLERGVGAALVMAAQKGLIDQTGVVRSYAPLPGSKPSSIPQQAYIVDDKIVDDDKRSRHDRYQGPLVPFKEKPGYTPGFRLEYHDAIGRELNAKEAFRDLSHKFHGKGPGKLKTERRTKKYLEEKLMREMPSADTPLRTAEKMKAKQLELQTPFILLSGSQAKSGPTPISKRSNF